MAKKKRRTIGKTSLTLSLTSQARDRLAEMSQKAGFSRSAFVENLMAGKVSLLANQADKNLSINVDDDSVTPPTLTIALADGVAPIDISEASDSSKEVDELQEKIAQQAAEIEALKNQTLPEVIENIDSGNSSGLEEEIATLKSKNKELLDSLDSAEKQLSELTKKSLAKEFQIEVNKEQNITLEKQLEEQYQRISILAKEVAQYKKQITKLDSVETQLEDAQKQLKEKSQQASDLVEEVAQQKEQVIALESAKTQLLDSQNQLEIQKKELQTQLTELQTNQEERFASLTSEKHSLEEQLSTLAISQKDLEKQVVNSQDLSRKCEQQATLIDQLKANSASDQGLLGQLKAEIAMAKQYEERCASLQHKCEEQSERLEVLELQAMSGASVAGIGEAYLNRWKKKFF